MGNRGKFHSKNKDDHLFFLIAKDRITEGIPKNSDDHFGGEIVAVSFWRLVVT